MAKATPPAIVARALHKSFGKVRALRGLTLEVARGHVLVLLGPNGAGKTTLVRILATLLRPDKGSAAVAGLDVAREGGRIRRLIGLAGQYAAVDENLTGRENLELVARFHHLPRAEATARAQELLQRFDLVQDADRVAKGYSGGMRRRLDLAAALVGGPDVLFLDEPTTGLDPPSRLGLWKQIDDLRKAGRTILMTTQNLEEAERLADSIAVVDKGTIIARGTAAELKRKVGGDVVEVHLADPSKTKAVVTARRALGPQTDGVVGRITVPAPKGAQTLADVLARLDPEALRGADVSLRRPTLDDVFLALTGHVADEAPKEGTNGRPQNGRRPRKVVTA